MLVQELQALQAARQDLQRASLTQVCPAFTTQPHFVGSGDSAVVSDVSKCGAAIVFDLLRRTQGVIITKQLVLPQH